jgi:hypothetical protein
MTTSVEGDVTSGMENGGYDVIWTDVNLTGSKNEENPRGQLSYFQMDGENLKQ